MDELLNRISSEELAEWLAFSRLEPFGPEWDLWRSGNIAATIANVNRARGQKAYKPLDFMPKVQQRQSPEEILEIMKTIGG